MVLRPAVVILFIKRDTVHVITVPQVEPHNWLGISLESWLTLIAIVIGPFLALLFQRWLDNLRQRRDRQVRVFRELMITRTQRLTSRHVEALNALTLEFRSGGKDKKIFNAWRAYLEHLGTDATKDSPKWIQKGGELLVELLYEMSQRLGPKLDKSRIEKEVYLPQLFNVVENEQAALRQRFLELLDGKGTRKLPVSVFGKGFPDIDLPLPDAGLSGKKS